MFGGTDNYQILKNKPSVNGVVLTGNKSIQQLGISGIPLAEIQKMFQGW